MSSAERLGPDARAAGGISTGRKLIVYHVLGDSLVLMAALALAGLARFSWGLLAFTEQPDLSWKPYAVAGCVWLVAVLRAFAARGLYDEDTLTVGGGEMARVWQSIVEGVAVISVASFLVRGEQLSRSWFFMNALLAATLMPLERISFRKILARARERGSLRRAGIIVSSGAQTIPDRLGEFDIVGRLDAAEFLDIVERSPDSGGGRDTAVLIDAGDLDEDTEWEVVLAAGQRGASVFMLSGLRAVTMERLTMRDLAGRTVTKVLPPRISGVRKVQKRVLDLVVVICSAPFFLVAGVVISVVQLVTAGRPIFYGQNRLGMDGKVFKMWKFRSMTVDAETESGPVWTAKNDPRRTSLGKFLRRSSLDELPQLWSVLKGDMSVVGPRPERPELVERFSDEIKWYRYRLRIKPGMTGSAQAKGLRGSTALEPRLELDNWYIENWSLALDLQILFRTVFAVIRGTNAE